MKIERGTQIAYIPRHAEGDITHCDVEFGFVTSVKERSVFCRFWRKGRPGELRTVCNSERTPVELLVEHKAVGQLYVDRMLEGM